jgi:hypothetical protein
MNPAGFYVYLLIDPRDGLPFYVGKGKGARHRAHVAEWRSGKVKNAAKFNRISEIVAAGYKVGTEILREGLTEPRALGLEHRAIEHLRPICQLTNVMDGTQTENQKAIALAQDCLRRVKPYCVWMADRPVGLDDSHYWNLFGEFHEAIALAKRLEA